MTTTVTISASRDHRVRVTPLSSDGGKIGPASLVEVSGTASFYVHSNQDLLIHEVQEGEAEVPPHLLEQEPILKFFLYAHLPDHLQVVSGPFARIAFRLVEQLPRNPERSVALRKLLEAKDAAVRAAVTD